MSVAAVKEDKTNFDTNWRLSERYSPNTSINADERMLPEPLSFQSIFNSNWKQNNGSLLYTFKS